MAKYFVGPSKLRSIAQQIRVQRQEFDASTTQVRNAVSALSSEWEGDAHNRFVQEQEARFQWFAQMSNLSEEIAQRLIEIAEEYERAEAAAAASVG